MSLSTNPVICIIYGSVWIDWCSSSIWPLFWHYFACLVISYWMSGIVNFPLFGAGYIGIFLLIFEHYSRMWFKLLGSSLIVLGLGFLALLDRARTVFSVGSSFSPNLGKTPMSTRLDALWIIMVITILASGYRALFLALCGNRGLCPLIPSCCTFPWGSLLSHTFLLVLGKHLRRTLGSVWSFLCDCPLSGTLPYRFCSSTLASSSSQLLLLHSHSSRLGLNFPSLCHGLEILSRQ